MDTLFGSAPSVKQLPSQPTVAPQQAVLAGTAANILEQGGWTPGVQPYPGPYVAPMTDQQNAAVTGLSGAVNTMYDPRAVQAGIPQTATGAELALMGFQPGQVSPAGYNMAGVAAPQQDTGYQAPTAGYTPTTPTIDPSVSSAAFQQGVVQPLTRNFEQQIMPTLKGAAGQSAGGIYSSDASRVGQLAASNLDQQLAGAGAQYTLAAEQANQQAQMQTNQLATALAQGDQSARLATNQLIQAARSGNQQAQEQLNQLMVTTGLTDAQLQQQAGEFNVGSQITGAGVRQAAIAGSPTTQTLPYAAPAAAASVLEGAYPTLSAPQLTAQQQVQGTLQDWYSQITQSLSRLGLMGQIGTATTMQPQTAVLPGQTGLVPSLLGGLASNPAVGYAALGPAGLGLLPFSDRRLKKDIRKIGKTDSLGLPIYTFKYKTDPDHLLRVGVMAQDVEQVYPEAVYEDADGIKAVNYSRVLLEESFPGRRAA